MKLADSLSAAVHADAESHFSANQFALLVRKYPFPKEVNPFTPEETAYHTYLRNEHRCKRLNARFRHRSLRKGKTVPWEYHFAKMRQFISYVIGDTVNKRYIYDHTGFGPGANIGVPSHLCNLARKLGSTWTVTPGAHVYGFVATMNHAQVRELMFPNAGGFVDGHPSDYDPFNGPYSKRIQHVAYNKLAFVPKTAKTDRPIAVEPLINSFLQKGVDELMRQQLKRIGIDLSDQEENSEMARIGSLSDEEDSFVTIDLSSASDSISIGLCRELLPPDWFEFLDSIRSRSYSYKKRVIRYHKFCSMGNGFCFPLETLLFVAACHACGCGTPGKDFRVYGDDIIVRKTLAPLVIELLDYMGFKVNVDKTFIDGPFRESCGTDWYGGVDVRPYTLDYALDSVQSLFKALNGMQRSDIVSRFFGDIRQFLIRQIPIDVRFFRPFIGNDDTAITAIGDEFLTAQHVYYRFRNGSGAWYWKELIPEPIPDRSGLAWARGHSGAMMYAALVGLDPRVPFSIRRKTRTKVRVISHPGATSQWLPPPSILW